MGIDDNKLLGMGIKALVFGTLVLGRVSKKHSLFDGVASKSSTLGNQ